MERADSAHDVRFRTRAHLIEQLNRAFLRELVDTFGKLFALHGVFGLHASEFFRRERRKVFKFEFMRGIGERVADTENSGVE